MMTTHPRDNRENPLDVMRLERGGMIGNRYAEIIKARGHKKPQTEAGHMTAPADRNINVGINLHNRGRPHMTIERGP